MVHFRYPLRIGGNEFDEHRGQDLVGGESLIDLWTGFTPALSNEDGMILPLATRLTSGDVTWRFRREPESCNPDPVRVLLVAAIARERALLLALDRDLCCERHRHHLPFRPKFLRAECNFGVPDAKEIP
jgi:hypothetical protein